MYQFFFSLAKDCRSVDDLLRKLAPFTQDEADVLEKATRGQWQSSLWEEQRQGRITASILYRVVTRMHTAATNLNTDTTNLIKSVLSMYQVVDIHYWICFNRD